MEPFEDQRLYPVHRTEPADLDETQLGLVRALLVELHQRMCLLVINGKTFEVEDYLLVGQRVWQLAFTPDEKLLFATNGNSNDVSVIDVPSLKVIKSVAVGSAPWGVAISQH